MASFFSRFVQSFVSIPKVKAEDAEDEELVDPQETLRVRVLRVALSKRIVCGYGNVRFARADIFS